MTRTDYKLRNAVSCVNVVSGKGYLPGVPMNDVEETGSEAYRNAAERLRELAEQTPVRDIQADLVSLAAYFDRMADHFEAQRASGLG
jgi:hypothetical protein